MWAGIWRAIEKESYQTFQIIDFNSTAWCSICMDQALPSFNLWENLKYQLRNRKDPKKIRWRFKRTQKITEKISIIKQSYKSCKPKIRQHVNYKQQKSKHVSTLIILRRIKQFLVLILLLIFFFKPQQCLIKLQWHVINFNISRLNKWWNIRIKICIIIF